MIRPAPVLALLAVLYLAPGFFYFGLARGEDAGGDLASSAVLVAADEPGEPLHVAGTVYGADGTTPVPGVVLYVYHTDAEGYYSATNDNTNPRLKATLESDAEGRYEYRTIKPAPYPGGGVAAHVHYVVGGAGHPEQRHELHFEGDPYLSPRAIERSREAGRFGSIRPLVRDGDGVWRVTFDLRLRR
jgi:protocatechuate 3,4-dioxygenase beta subunit